VIEPAQPHAKRLTAFDRHVGARVRLARQSRGLSQSELGRHVGLTFQQVQKYERGFNRISAGRLYEMSVVLSVDVTFFFEGLDKPNTLAVVEARTKKAMALFDAISGIKDIRIRKQLLALIWAMTAENSPTDEGGASRKKPRKLH
jgi:transcriptional regulator with XRE-family HTH domain